MHPGRRWTAVVPVLLAALLVLAGCSGSAAHPAAARRPAPTTRGSSTAAPAPARTTTPDASTPTATPTPTPTLAPPVMPYAATLHTAEGADAYVRYWFAVLQYAFLSGNTAYFNRYSLPQCGACQHVSKIVTDQYASGGSFSGGVYRIDYVSSPDPDQHGAAVSFGVHESALNLVGKSGDVEETDPPDVLQRATFFAKWVDDGWRTFDVALSR